MLGGTKGPPISQLEILEIAAALRIPLPDLKDTEKLDRVVDVLMISRKSETVKEGAARLGISVTEDQALAIATCFSVPHHAKKGPLTPAEHTIAVELLYHGLKKTNGAAMTNAEARMDAANMVNFGERGLTVLHKIGDASGCFKMVLLLVGVSTTLGVACFLLLHNTGR